MFLKTYTELPVDFDRVRAAMRQRPLRWLEGLADDTGSDSQRMLVAVGLEVGGHMVDRPARLTVGEPVTTEHVASLPLRLRFEDHDALFPSLDGSLDAAWLGAGRTHLALSLQYEPPFGVLGRIADRALLHRVAEAVAQRFLQKIAGRLNAQFGPQVPSANGSPATA